MRLLVALGRALRPPLNQLYDVCGALAGLFLVALLLVIVLQMAARWSGQQFPGSTDYAGYCMAAASFFALAYALNRGAHIRVTLLLSQLGRWRRLGELWSVGISAALACYFAYYAIKGVHVSYRLHDISQGQDATPLWIPQLVMAIGGCVFALALVDRLVQVAFGGSWELDRPLDQDASASDPG